MAPATIEAVGVVIPVRNGADTIARCILSIFAANSFAGWKKAIWVVVVADACTDDSVKVARRVLGAFGEVLVIAAKSYRAARRVGASAVFDHFHRKPQNAILLANTNANAYVQKDWITIQMRRATRAPYSKIAATSDTGAGTDRPPILRSMRYINARETRVVQTRT
jgi:glycosyltransferase involved in cell wall biosynthesis